MAPLRTVLSLALLGLASSAGQFGRSHHHSTYSRPSSTYGAPSTSYGAPRATTSNFGTNTAQTSFQNSAPSFQSSAPSFQRSAPSFQSSAPSFQSSAPVRQTQKVFNSRPQGFQSQGVRAVQGSSRYYLSWANGDKRMYTWDEADHECRRNGMRLISLDSFQKESEINTLLDAAPFNIPFYWTSATRNNGVFMWGERGNGKHTPVCRIGSRRDVCYENWGRAGQRGVFQPDNAEGQENCLAVLNRFYPGDGITWHDIACHHQKHFVCEPTY